MTEAQLSPLQQARIFARYAYVPEPNWSILDTFADDEFAALKHDLLAMNKADLLRRMSGVAQSVFQDTFDNLNDEIVIPLSGGRDSRFILCMAIEHGLKDRILAVTWGVPGGLDWEIARKVTAHFGVRHECIDTCARPITFADLKRAFHYGARWSDLISAHFNQRWRAVAPAEACGIIGYLAGSSIGCCYEAGHETLDFAAAVEIFESMNRRSTYGRPVIGLVADRLLSPDRVTLPEQLDLVFRQEGYLRRVVAPSQFNTRTPFAHPVWLRTMYALPPSCRLSGELFSAFLIEKFPKAFDIGTSGAYGLRADAPRWRRRIARQLLRLRCSVANALRPGPRLTFDKYGDDRDLLAGMRQASDTEVNRPPRQLDRLLKSEAGGARDAARIRLHAMLLCNLICLREEQETPQTNAA